jgi:hypothetical protein
VPLPGACCAGLRALMIVSTVSQAHLLRFLHHFPFGLFVQAPALFFPCPTDLNSLILAPIGKVPSCSVRRDFPLHAEPDCQPRRSFPATPAALSF